MDQIISNYNSAQQELRSISPNEYLEYGNVPGTRAYHIAQRVAKTSSAILSSFTKD